MKSKIYLFLLALAMLGQMSCKDYVEGINEDPNNPADAPEAVVLNAVNTSIITGHESHSTRMACMWSNQFTGSDRQYSGFGVYNTSSSDFSWDLHYIAMQNCDIVIEKTTASNNLLGRGIAQVLKAHTLGMVTSMWGKVPYAQANNYPEVLDPKFDDQMAVYDGVQSILDAAITDLSGGPTNSDIAAVDFYFDGDAAKWEAAANTLKARFYLHIKNYEAAAGAAAKGILASDGDWMVPHPGGVYLQDQNFYYSFGKVDREGYMTANNAELPAMLDTLNARYRGNEKTNEKARFAFVYVGGEGTYDLNYSGMFAPDASYPFATAAETHLILAECEWRAGNMAEALTHLNHTRAILAAQFPNGKYEDYVMADFEEGGMAGRSGESADDALLYEILEEKYCTLVGQMEVFNDLRRTKNHLGLTPVTGSAFPQRLLIPQAEIDANASVPNPLPDLFAPTQVNQ